ncbi:MAG: right-handed parallel beta-helix repeat-containing protein [Candidatus Omnitrophica bacterium]|nr:right-handed parallel beta-helix repeat-containing protein [Candidatus Omnitrophota bacterium]
MLKNLYILSVLLILLCCIGVVPARAAGDLTTGLVAWWSFDESQGNKVYDLSPTGNHGMFEQYPDFPSLRQPGKIGQALGFNASPSYMEAPYSSALDFDNTVPFTIAFWEKDLPLVGQYTGVLGHSSGSGYYFSRVGNDLVFYLRNTWATNLIGISVHNAFNGSWRHIAVIYDGSSKAAGVKIYINGVIVPGSVVYDNLTASTKYAGKFTIGTTSMGGDRIFNGFLDEVRIYNRALSSEDISGIIQLPTTSTPNQPPAVSAGTDQTIALNDTASLQGVVTDDGVPSPFLLTHRWTSVSGPGVVSFDNADQLVTSAHFSQPGTYVLKLTATDGFLSSSSNVMITVRPSTVNAPIPSPINYYIAPNGSDSNNGSLQSPFATLEKARDTIRVFKQGQSLPGGGVTVWMRGGTYSLSQSFTLSALDSGTPNAPIVYRSYPDEKVVLSGGRELGTPLTIVEPAILQRLPAASRGKVVMFDVASMLKDNGGDLLKRGLGASGIHPWMVELHYNHQKLELAHWPNAGWAYNVNPVPGDGHYGPQDNWFSYNEDNPSHWALTEGVYVHGMFSALWSDHYHKISSIDPSVKKIVTDAPDSNSDGYTTSMAPYRALNVLEDLDLPGEWVFDAANRKIFVYPPETYPQQPLVLSVLAGSLIKMDSVDDVTIRGLSFEYARGSGIEAKNCHRLLIAGDIFHNLGNLGVVIGKLASPSQFADNITFDFQGGESNGVVGCEIHDVGEGGIYLAGGDRTTLTPARHYAVNNHVYNSDRNVHMSRGGIYVVGVGSRVANCVVHDVYHQGIQFYGNDHIIELNKVYNTNLESQDSGSIYGYQIDWKNRGVVIRYNEILAQPAQAGVYLDGGTSGTSVYGNIIYFNGGSIQVGGGRDNVFENNLIITANKERFDIGGWIISAGAASVSMLTKRLQAVAYTSTPYNKYSGLSTTLTDDPALPKGTVFERNIFLMTTDPLFSSFDFKNNQALEWPCVTEQDSFRFASYDPGFIDPNAIRSMHFELKDTSLPVMSGFQQIPQDLIGAHQDEYGVVDPDKIPAYPPAPQLRRPYNGIPIEIPGIVETEDFDRGGEGLTFHTGNPVNLSTSIWTRYRHSDNVSIWGWLDKEANKFQQDITLDKNEWTEYSLHVSTSGTYDVVVKYPGTTAAGFHLDLDGLPLASGLSLPVIPAKITVVPNKNVLPAAFYVTTNVATLHLTAGQHVLRLTADSSIRIDHVEFNLVQAEAPPVSMGSGDVSGNGAVTMYDAALTLRGGLTPAQQKEADINGDATVDVMDASAIARKALGLQ